MTDESRLDAIRGKALHEIRQWEFISKWLFWLAAAFEVGLGVTFLLLIDFSNSLHVLLLIAVATVYVPLVLLLMSVSGQLDRNTVRILRAIELRETGEIPGERSKHE